MQPASLLPPDRPVRFFDPHGAATGRLQLGQPCLIGTTTERPALFGAFRRSRPRSAVTQHRSKTVNRLVNVLTRLGLLTEDLDYHLIRASMVLIFLAFGYQKWFAYEAQVLIPYISHGPLIFWLYPVFGIQGASWFLGVSEWLIGALLFLGFWDKRLGILGALGSTATFIMTVTIIPFMPNGWDPVAGFPAMAGNVPFLIKDVVLLAASIYLLKQDVARVALSARHGAAALQSR